jgi:DNA-binding transcriptional LysR family regulator
MDPLETAELQAFVRVVDAGSLSAAAAELAVPRATVGRRLARLEERLGARLLHRTTRRLTVTAAGEELYGRARSILADVEAATLALRVSDEPRGLLRVSVPPVSERWFRELILSFLARYPAVELELLSSTRIEDLLGRDIDLAWRAATDLDPGLVARQLMVSDRLAVASPAYLARAGTPARTEDLAHHTCLLGFTGDDRPATHWPLRDGGRVRVHGRLVTNDLALLGAAAEEGLGIALVPRPVVRGALAGGRLVPVLEDVLGATTRVALVYPERRLLKPAARALIDHAVAWTEARG